MADAITIKALQDASLDAKSLEEVVNGNESKQVTTRLGETYPSVKKAVKTLFENGGLPATPFATKALMTASALVDSKYAMVTDDAVNNGLYVKTAGAWVKSEYDFKTIMKANSDAIIYGQDSFNIDGGHNQNGTFYIRTDWKSTDYIECKKGDTFDLTATVSSSDSAITVFNTDKVFIKSVRGTSPTAVIDDYSYTATQDGFIIAQTIIPSDYYRLVKNRDKKLFVTGDDLLDKAESVGLVKSNEVLNIIEDAEVVDLLAIYK